MSKTNWNQLKPIETNLTSSPLLALSPAPYNVQNIMRRWYVGLMTWWQDNIRILWHLMTMKMIIMRMRCKTCSRHSKLSAEVQWLPRRVSWWWNQQRSTCRSPLIDRRCNWKQLKPLETNWNQLKQIESNWNWLKPIGIKTKLNQIKPIETNWNPLKSMAKWWNWKSCSHTPWDPLD